MNALRRKIPNYPVVLALAFLVSAGRAHGQLCLNATEHAYVSIFSEQHHESAVAALVRTQADEPMVHELAAPQVTETIRSLSATEKEMANAVRNVSLRLALTTDLLEAAAARSLVALRQDERYSGNALIE